MSDEQETGWTREIQQALLRPFPNEILGFLPRGGQGERCLALPHIDARDVMTRLDNAVGPANWCFTWELAFQAGDVVAVKGRLIVLGKIMEDAGEDNSSAERLKAAVSDALKRTAVHAGVGRYLYFLDPLWVPWDGKRFREKPRLDPQAVAEAARKAGWKGEAPAPATGRPQVRVEQGGRAVEPDAPPREIPTEPERRPAPSNPPEERRPQTPRPEPAAGQGAPGNGMVCTWEGCGAGLTKGQQDLSLRSFGALLCPRHQREQAQAK